MLAPKRRAKWAGRSVALEGNLWACMAYAELTGDGLEASYYKLEPQLKRFEELSETDNLAQLDREYPITDLTPWAHLMWAFTASWRYENWDNDHQGPEESGKPVKRCPRFVRFMERATIPEARAARPILFGLLLESILEVEVPPETAAAEGDAARRSAESSESPSTGSSTT